MEAGYTCAGGYTTNAEADGPTTFELKCNTDGSFDPHEGCKPVKCGSIYIPAHSEQVAP